MTVEEKRNRQTVDRKNTIDVWGFPAYFLRTQDPKSTKVFPNAIVARHILWEYVFTGYDEHVEIVVEI